MFRENIWDIDLLSLIMIVISSLLLEDKDTESMTEKERRIERKDDLSTSWKYTRVYYRLMKVSSLISTLFFLVSN